MLLLPLLLISLRPIANPVQLESLESFNKRVDKIFADSGVPGGGIRCIKNGKIVYERTYGVADIEKKTPVNIHMPFEIGSLSKQFTAVSALMLVQDGKLSLKETIGSIVPEVPQAWKSATIDQIMHHMSGIPDYEEIAGYDFYNTEHKENDIINQAAKQEPAFKPGDKFFYSNTGYYLVSMVVERRSGMPFAQFLKKRIFDKLGMKSTYGYPKPAGLSLMTGYHSRTGKRVAQPPIAWTSSYGAGAIVSTLDDFMKWDAALYTEKLLKRDLLDKIWTATTLNDGKANLYGYGWFDNLYRGMKMRDHSGQTNGFTCIYQRLPDQRCSVWTFANTYDGGGPFSAAKAAIIRFVPEANYSAIPIKADANPDRTKAHRTALSQALNGGDDMSLLAPNVKAFATNPQAEVNRNRLKNIFLSADKFDYLRTQKRLSPTYGWVDEFVYRQKTSTSIKYWTLGFARALMVGLTVEDE